MEKKIPVEIKIVCQQMQTVHEYSGDLHKSYFRFGKVS